MRRLFWTFLMGLSLAVVVAGCVPVSFVNQATGTPAGGGQSATGAPSPATTAVVTAPLTAAPATIAPAPAPTGTATIAPAPAPTETATVAPTPAPTQAPPEASGGQVVTYTSPRLGIRFDYLSIQNGMAIGVQEAGDKVYVFPSTMKPADGQWVQVYGKAANETLEAAIARQVLHGYSTRDCLVQATPNPNAGSLTPAGYRYALIKLPITDQDTPDTIQAKARKCPQPYAAYGGLAYFMADAQHPDRFLFFSIGQYGILAGANTTWQATLRVTDRGGPAESAYLDDRSGPVEVLQSLFNAINRHEYARAYSYWQSQAGDPGGPPPFDQFQKGYAGTAYVDLATGPVTGGVAAGNIYYAVPATLIAQTTGGATQTFVGCFTLHQGNPANYGAPPFTGLGIQSAQVKQVANDADTTGLMESACAGVGEGQPVPATPAPAPGDIGQDRYIDNRSGPVEVLQSLFNAINRREYARAYSYWQSQAGAAGGPPPYDQFAKGYADTASVTIRVGTVTPDAGAGQVYYSAPTTLIAKTSGGATQTFVGCYVLHVSNPGIQGAPPFQPLGIIRGSFKQVANDADTAALMASACQ